MSRVCYKCGKKPMAGNNISKSRRHTKRRFLPNLQKVRIQTDSGNRRVRMCTRCIRTGKFVKAISHPQATML